jgi:hypothetical protein
VTFTVLDQLKVFREVAATDGAVIVIDLVYVVGDDMTSKLFRSAWNKINKVLKWIKLQFSRTHEILNNKNWPCTGMSFVWCEHKNDPANW